MGRSLTGTPPERRALRVREAVAAYRLGKTKLYALLKQGKLASVKVGGTRLILVESLETLIASSRANPSPGDPNPPTAKS